MTSLYVPPIGCYIPPPPRPKTYEELCKFVTYMLNRPLSPIEIGLIKTLAKLGC